MVADQADDITSLSMAQYIEARDFLIVTLTRAVGTRPSALENAMFKMFENAKCVITQATGGWAGPYSDECRHRVSGEDIHHKAWPSSD